MVDWLAYGALFLTAAAIILLPMWMMRTPRYTYEEKPFLNGTLLVPQKGKPGDRRPTII